MSSSQWQDELTSILRQMQIIIAALVAGCVTLLVVVVVLSQGKEPSPDVPMLTYVAAGFAAMALVMRTVVLTILTTSTRRKIAKGTWQMQARGGTAMARALEQSGDAGKLAILFQIRTIISGAMFEGPAFFLLIAYLIERSQLSLILAVILIVGLMMQMPLRQRMIAWIEDQLTLIEQERQFDR